MGSIKKKTVQSRAIKYEEIITEEVRNRYGSRGNMRTRKSE